MSFERARRIADAILYEGYVLYPYRASSRKNRFRWTFGVLAPRAWSDAGGCERASLQVECLIATDEVQGPIALQGCLRFLQVERRTIEAAHQGGFVPVETLDVDGEQHITWEEGIEREVPFAVELPSAAPTTFAAHQPEAGTIEPIERHGLVVGRVARRQRPLAMRICASTEPLLDGRLLKLRITVENVTPLADLTAPREEAVASSLVGAHLLLSLGSGGFVSLLEPPVWAAGAVASCRNEGAFPVLAGEAGARDLLMASPIVLYDHPQIAAESPGDSFDGTEVDELLALSTRSLTDEEKREARATDARAASVIDRAEGMSAETLLGLHGRNSAVPAARPHGALGPGCRVRIRLAAATGARRTDAQDMFLDGRIGTVAEVREDFDGRTYLALVIDDDPAAEMHRWYGRHLHFEPDEVELVEAAR